MVAINPIEMWFWWWRIELFSVIGDEIATIAGSCFHIFATIAIAVLFLETRPLCSANR